MSQVALEIDSATGIAILTLDRPNQLNALSSSLLRELDEAVDRIEHDDAIRGVVDTGAGRAFAAGADIEEIAQLDWASGLEFARCGQRVFSRIDRLEKPVVAAVNGFALGGGCELAMACHVRVASTKAKLGQPEVKLGIPPGFGGTQRLPRIVGRGVATKLILTGEAISADEALRIGLVSEVVAPEELFARAKALLAEILRNGPQALAASLAAIRDGLDTRLDEGLEIEARAFSAACGTDEMREGTSAFLTRRPPRFR